MRSEERRKVEAEQRASGVGGKRACVHQEGIEQKQGRVSTKNGPDEPLIEKRLQEVEYGVFHAEPLEEVASKAECKDEEDRGRSPGHRSSAQKGGQGPSSKEQRRGPEAHPLVGGHV